MASTPPSQEDEPSSRDAQQELATGPYVLRTLLHDIPLSEDGGDDDDDNGNDVRIKCVDYIGNSHPWPGQLLMLTASPQAATFISAPLPRNCSISSKSPPTLPTSLASRSSYLPRGYARHITRAPLPPGIRNQGSNRSYCCLGSRKHACSATTPSPSTPYRSSAQYSEPCE